ncbi:M1 family aminopeptidase [Longimicrobium sp.]|uniref:M1 family metallopeptidase n=1 Tax=Longimicrobium sp. TaxID=2029185 RepID=UPI002B518B58|nr:M1 family aminopeptidase [Longimicrobium sp.]HSU17748.1 M1 family aminopeptidase [Longimicrobium sp.]
MTHRPTPPHLRALATVLAAASLLAACRGGSGARPQSPRPETLMQPGISRELAAARAATLSDVRYDLWLDLTQRDTAAGIVRMAFTRAKDAGDLVADFRGPTLLDVRANGDAVRDFDWRNGHVRIPGHHLKGGANVVEMRFATRIAPVGASIIRFDDRSDGTSYLYTLLVPSDANLLFPCFDQPDLKARFRWRLSAPAAWTVIANARAESRDTSGAGVTWSFAQTEPIPTYLAAFAAGPWAAWESAPAGGRPVTLYGRRSRRAEVDADSVIRANREAARWLEGWFAVPFPFSKLDAVLAPAFPFGGMEHVGEIFYNENSFIFREPPTLSQRLGRDATIYHEVSHQWFGDLVTMRWFDDLWLKEGFSTYMAARIQDELSPGSEAWKTFYLRNKPVAYATDATSGTTPVWQELANLDLAKSNYGPIVYNKAPSVIKQLAFLAGDSAFRAGLHLFLTRHAYGNATWQDLLGAVQETSGVPLRQFGEQYILRAGMPRVDTRVEGDGSLLRRVVLTQRPVREMPGDRGGWWPMKVRVRLGYHDRPDVVLPAQFAGDSAVVDGAAGLPMPDYVWANDGDYGYGLFIPDERSAAWIAGHVGEVRDGLLRAMLWGALWDLVRDTRLPPARFAEIALRELPRERDEQIASVIVDRGAAALVRYAPDADAARLFPAWERMLAARAQDASLGYGMRKESLDALAGTARTAEGRAVLREYLAGTRLFNGAAVKQPTRWSMVQRLLALGEPHARALYEAEVRRDSTPEAARRAFVARAATPDSAVKAEYFRRYLDDPTLNEEWVTASLGAFNEGDQTALTLPFLRSSLERLEWIRDNRRIFFLPSWINAFVRGQESARALATVDRLLAESPDLPIDIRRKVLQARDELERTVAIRRAAGAGT